MARYAQVGDEGQQRACEEEYERILQSLERQLGETRYALGDQMCAVDAVLLGGLRAHFHLDPVPKRVVERFPRVVAWAAQQHRPGQGGSLWPFPDSTPFARFIVEQMAPTYARVAAENARAIEHKEKAFSASIYGQDVSFLTRPYPEQSRRMIQRHIRERLSDTERAGITTWLADAELPVFAP